MHTTIPSSEPTLADLISVMIRMQIEALETLQRCMQDPESTGDEKKDRAEALKLNRKRMAATQTLLHCRTMFREIREAEAQTHRIAEEMKQSERKAIYDLASRRRLHKTYPGEYDDPDAPCGMAMQSMAMQGAESPESAEGIAKLRVAMPHTPSPPTDNQSGEGGIQPQVGCRMRGRPESSDDQSASTLGATAQAEGAGHADHATADTPSRAIPPAQPTRPTEQPKGLARFEQLKRQRDEMLARRRAEALAAEQNTP